MSPTVHFPQHSYQSLFIYVELLARCLSLTLFGVPIPGGEDLLSVLSTSEQKLLVHKGVLIEQMNMFRYDVLNDKNENWILTLINLKCIVYSIYCLYYLILYLTTYHFLLLLLICAPTFPGNFLK